MFKVNNKDTKTTPRIVLVSLMLTLTYFTPNSSASAVNFEHVLEGYPLFTKTFATVNPDILLKKIECHRIRGIINCWFQSYQIGCSSLL